MSAPLAGGALNHVQDSEDTVLRLSMQAVPNRTSRLLSSPKRDTRLHTLCGMDI